MNVHIVLSQNAKLIRNAIEYALKSSGHALVDSLEKAERVISDDHLFLKSLKNRNLEMMYLSPDAEPSSVPSDVIVLDTKFCLVKSMIGISNKTNQTQSGDIFLKGKLRQIN